MPLKIGISGKRFIADNDRTRLIEEIKTYIDALLLSKATNSFTGFTSLATGADSIFADLILNYYKQPLVAILPFQAEEYKKDFQGADLAQMEMFLKQATESIIVTDIVPIAVENRNEAYLAAGAWIANEADELLIVWDKLKPAGLGGSSDVLSIRDANGKTKAKEFYVRPKDEDQIIKLIQDQYLSADELAKVSRDKYKIVWKMALIMAWVTVIIFATTTAFKTEDALTWLLSLSELLLVGGVFLLVYFAKKHNYHGKYLGMRMDAERFRLFEFFYNANIPLELSTITKKENKVLADVVESINKAIEKNKYHSYLFSGYWIRKLISGQLNYHEQKIHSSGKKQEALEQFNSLLGIVFIVNVLIHFITVTVHYFFHITPPHILEELLTFLSIALPATYAGIEGFVYFQDYEAIKRNSEDILENLKKCLDMAPDTLVVNDFADCRTAQLKCVNLIANTMLNDNRNWHTLFENKNNYHWII